MTSTLSGFRLERPIGRGAMGEVWRAHAADGTAVAIKVAHQDVVDNPKLMRLIDGEVRAMARLDHPYVTWVYDHGRVPEGTTLPAGAPFIVLEHCGAGTLFDRKLTGWPEVRDVVSALLDALGHAHARGIVHRDLKPANVLWASPDDVRPGPKLGDFGIAYAVGGDLGGPAAGSPYYMAPEQASGGSIGPWTDLFALGAVTWELCTGSPPFDGSGPVEILLASRRGILPFFRPSLEVPRGLEGWLARLLAPKVADRFARAADALRALAALDPTVPVPGRAWRSAERSGPRLRLQGAGLALLPLRELEVAGRVEERDRLWRSLTAVVDAGDTRVVVLRGPSGVGKTRLATWLAERAAELALAEPVRIGGRDAVPLESLLVGLLKLTALPPELRAASVCSALEARGIPATGVQRIAGLLAEPLARWGTVPAVRQVVRALTDGAPWVLVLDDAEESESLVRFTRVLLAERVASSPILAVLVVDDAATPDLAALIEGLHGLPGVDVLTLGPLPPADQELLLTSFVGLDPESHAAVLAAAGGHPGTIVARVSQWARDGVLAPTARGFRRVRPVDEPPLSLANIWARRLKEVVRALGGRSSRMLERAAIVGLQVDEELWEAACDDPEATLAGSGQVRIDAEASRIRLAIVDALIASGLAHETDTGFAFADLRVVEALVTRARAHDRDAAHHRACAAHLARRPQPANALRLGHHLAGARAWSEAVDALIAGIDWTWTRGDQRPLLAEVERAEACADRGGLAPTDTRRGRIGLLRAVILMTVGRIPEAKTAARRAWEIAGDDGRLMVDAAMRLVDIHTIEHDWQGAEYWCREFLQVEDQDHLRYRGGIVRGRMGKAAQERGDDEQAAAWFDAGERRLQTCPRTPKMLTALLELYGWRGDVERIRVVAAEAELESAEAGLVHDQAFAAAKLTEAAVTLGRWDEARAAGRRALALAETHGDHRAALVRRGQIANVEVRAGNYAEGLRWAEEALANGTSFYPWVEAMMAMLVAECRLRLGDLEGWDRAIVALGIAAARVPTEVQFRAQLLEWAGELRTSGQVARAEAAERAAATAHSEAGAVTP